MFVEIDEQGNKIDPSDEKSKLQSPIDNTPPTGPLPPAPDKLANFVLHNHIHPILVHTPNGLIPVIVFFMLLGIYFHFQGFEQAAYYNLVIVLLAMPAVMVTGYLEWQRRYNGAKTVLFLTKISCSLVVFATILILAGWRFINPEVTAPASPTRWVYLSISLIMLVATGIAGHLGGKLVFGSRGK
jgi:uncharacterized membrane protein